METGPGQVGVVVVGLGSVGSSLVAGVLAQQAHLVHPWGSLVEGGGAAHPTRAEHPLRSLAPLAPASDLALCAIEVRDDDAYRAALRARVLSRSLIEELKPTLLGVPLIRGDRHTESRRELACAIAADLRGFSEHAGVSRTVVVCTVPGSPTKPSGLPRTEEELYQGLAAGADWLSAGLLYAVAAAEAGCGFVGAARDGALHAPGLRALFARLNLPLVGAGLLGPDAALRMALGELIQSEQLGFAAATCLTTREGRVQGWPGQDRIQELGFSTGWAGSSLELSFELRGPVAPFLAARAYDAALLCDLSLRAGKGGTQEWLSALFADPVFPGPWPADAPTWSSRYAELKTELASFGASLAAPPKMVMAPAPTAAPRPVPAAALAAVAG